MNDLTEEKKKVEAELVNVKWYLEDALNTVKTKEAVGEQLKKAVSEKEDEIKEAKSTVIRLKKIGRGLRDRAEAAVNNLRKKDN